MDVIPLLERLVEIDSVNPGLGGGGEDEIAMFVAEWAGGAGLEVELDEAAPGRPNVIATAKGSGGGRTLLLNGHLDTVGHEGMAAPLEPRVEDGRLYGRGSYDMKGGLAACLVATAEAGIHRVDRDEALEERDEFHARSLRRWTSPPTGIASRSWPTRPT